jgi:tetratricopeptide (TPR) repeat protein
LAFDRAATLRHAEKLLQRGKLDAAIAAYATLVEQQPADWNTANTLGDLYLRAGKSDRAAELFSRSAARLTVEGFFAKAGALYKKILKLKPDDETTLLLAAETAARQGLFADARAYFGAVADHRTTRGDARGAAEIRIRIDTLDPGDFDRRIAAARLRAEVGEIATAVRELSEIAKELAAKHRDADALKALEEAARLAPDDTELRARFVRAAVAAGDFARARGHASSVEELTVLADALDAHGRADEALDTLRLVARLCPDNRDLALRLTRACVARGDAAGAAEFMTADAALGDPPLLLEVAELQLRAGRMDDALAAIRRFLKLEAEAREQLALLACRLAEETPDAGLRALEVAVDEAAGRSDWAWAVAAMQEFARRAPAHIPALLRLVELCVDGGVESALRDAHIRLTDAYLATGAGAEARTIAEDLVDREPWEPSHVDRLRRALVLLNVHDPDAEIAARLGAPEASAPPLASASPDAIDIDEIVELPAEPIDIDLGTIGAGPAPILASDLDGVFEQLREEATVDAAADTAQLEYRRGLALRRAGDLDASIPAFEAATRSPRVRFAAAAELGRVFKERGDTTEAIEWFERAAQAAPDASDSYDILYELADSLDAVGEAERSLAVLLELQAEAGEYRDVAVRIDRLTNERTQG